MAIRQDMANTDQETDVLARRTVEAQVRQVRARAALAMVIASVAVGFIAGRASGWLVPFDAPPAGIVGQQQAQAQAGPEARRWVDRHKPVPVSDGKSSKPPAPLSLPEQAAPKAPEPKAVEQRQPGREPSSTVASALPGPKEPAKTGGQEPAEPANKPVPAAVDSGALPRAPEPAGKADQGSPREGVTLINPGRVGTGPDAQDLAPTGFPARTAGADGGANPAGFEECQRRYSSFRPSDGTYQPFGGGSRARCPHLR